jgi:hypothetical protein
MNRNKLSFKKYLIYLKILKFKINLFIPKNTIEFIISHYNEDFKYLDYLPENQIITIYYKGNKSVIELPKKNLNINIIYLKNIGKEYHTYLTHIINRYENLSKINFFISASFINLKDRTRNFTKIYNKISKIKKEKFNGLYTSEDKFFLFKKEKEKLLDPKMRIFNHTTSQKIMHNMIPSEIFPLDNFFATYFKDKKLDKYITSLNGIFAANKENITSIDKEIYKSIIKEYKIPQRDYESGHYLERLYPSIFRLNEK